MTVRPLAILVVDDDPTIRTILASMLGPLGHRVTAVGTVAAALEHLADASFDAALVDIHMQPEDGISLIERIRATGSRMPVAVISGDCTHEDLDRLQRAGGADVMLKPVTRHAVTGFLGRVGLE